jgi:hypothetical protein
MINGHWLQRIAVVRAWMLGVALLMMAVVWLAKH